MYSGTGWIKTAPEYVNPDYLSEKYWFYIENGVMKTGWLLDGGCWFYLSEEDSDGGGNIDGWMITGSKSIGGSTYWFNANGRCYSGNGCSSSCNY